MELFRVRVGGRVMTKIIIILCCIEVSGMSASTTIAMELM